MEAAALRRFVPPHVRFPERRAERGRGPCEQRDQLTAQQGGVEEMLPHQRPAPEVVVTAHEEAPALALLLLDGANEERSEIGVLISNLEPGERDQISGQERMLLPQARAPRRAGQLDVPPLLEAKHQVETGPRGPLTAGLTPTPLGAHGGGDGPAAARPTGMLLDLGANDRCP